MKINSHTQVLTCSKYGSVFDQHFRASSHFFNHVLLAGVVTGNIKAVEMQSHVISYLN